MIRKIEEKEEVSYNFHELFERRERQSKSGLIELVMMKCVRKLRAKRDALHLTPML
jgi:hypothetical protein